VTSSILIAYDSSEEAKAASRLPVDSFRAATPATDWSNWGQLTPVPLVLLVIARSDTSDDGGGCWAAPTARGACRT
jgi:hypothetical protein